MAKLDKNDKDAETEDQTLRLGYESGGGNVVFWTLKPTTTALDVSGPDA